MGDQERASEKSFLRVGLTGGVSSGKSTVARIFSENGIPVIDADALVRELSSPGGKAHAEIVSRFGTADRGVLRERVFRDPAERKALEAILHPWVARESAARMDALKLQGFPGVVYEAALLIEAGRAPDFDEVIVVVAPREQRIQRMMQRDGVSEIEANAVLAAQMEDSERLMWATRVLQNDSDREQVQRSVTSLIHQLFP